MDTKKKKEYTRIYSLNSKEGGKEENNKDMRHIENKKQNGRHKSNHIGKNIKCEWTI